MVSASAYVYNSFNMVFFYEMCYQLSHTRCIIYYNAGNACVFNGNANAYDRHAVFLCIPAQLNSCVFGIEHVCKDYGTVIVFYMAQIINIQFAVDKISERAV